MSQTFSAAFLINGCEAILFYFILLILCRSIYKTTQYTNPYTLRPTTRFDKLSAVKIIRTVRRFMHKAATMVSAFSLAFCLDGSLQICLCEADSDGCGSACHECTPESDDSCTHLTVQIDAHDVPHVDINIPTVVTAPPPPEISEQLLSSTSSLAIRRPASTAPPDDCSIHISFSKRLYPRS